MKSTLIKDTTKSERIALVKQWEEEEGCENSGMNLMEYFRDYIDGKKEIAEVNALAKIYGIQKNEESKEFLNSIIEAGTVSLAAKTAITTLKAMPGVNIGATALNEVIAGCIIAALGEGSIYAFEQVYIGKKTVEDIDWVRKLIEAQFSSRFIDKAMKIVPMMTEKADKNTVKEAIFDLFNLKSSK